MSEASAEHKGKREVGATKSWVHPQGEGENAYRRQEGVVIKHTTRNYINAQITYWGGTHEEPRGPKFRLIKMRPQNTPEWDFDSPDECIELKSDEIAKLRSFLNEEFRSEDIGSAFWVPFSDRVLADSLVQLLAGEKTEAAHLEQFTAALSLDPELVLSILETDQAELAIEIRERSRRTKVLDELEKLIMDKEATESCFQKLLEYNPWVFGGEVVKANELRTIGTTDQVDVPIVRGDGSMVVVELKRASAVNIARRDHDYPILTSDVHLAVQQSQRYLYELDRLADTLMVKHGFDARRATALVVIGVSSSVEEKQRDKFHESFRIYNSHLARVQVTTYDDLLKNARRLIELKNPNAEIS